MYKKIEQLLEKNDARLSADKKWALLLTPKKDIQKNRVKHPTVRVRLEDFLQHLKNTID